MANELAGKFTGCVLICGSAPCLFSDYKQANAARPEATVIAINKAASAIDADFLVSLHHAKMAAFRRASKNPNIVTLSGAREWSGSDIDYWFTECNSGGTSAGSAIKIARKMGFSEIILCGCPMEGGDGYFNAPPRRHGFIANRFGNAPANSVSVRRHQENLWNELIQEGYSNVRSMSGYTARIFGLPDFAHKEAA